MKLTHYVNELVETLNDGVNLLVKQKFNKFEDVADISNDDLEGYKALQEAFKSYCDYVKAQADKTDEIVSKLDEIQQQLRDMNYTLEEIKHK